MGKEAKGMWAVAGDSEARAANASAYVSMCRWHADVAFAISYNRRATISPKNHARATGQERIPWQKHKSYSVPYHRVRERKEPKPSSEQKGKEGWI